MKIEFGRIFKQLLSEMPTHSAKPNTWIKINDRLDDDNSISKMRDALKQTEHAPKQELWGSIESNLNRFDNRRFNYTIISFVLPLLAVIGGFFISPLIHKNTDLQANEIIRSKNKIDILRHKYAENDSKINNKQHLLASNNNIYKNNLNSQQKDKNDSSLAHELNNDSLKYLIHSNGTYDFDFTKKPSYSISGIIKWEMAQKGYLSLDVYSEDGKFVINIFEKKKYDVGEQSYNFKMVDYNIEKNKKYFLKLKLRNAVIKEIECNSNVE